MITSVDEEKTVVKIQHPLMIKNPQSIGDRRNINNHRITIESITERKK